ncbi:MAG: hypothetical protein ACJ74Z_01340 [Bryobacteraceae bacterium]
MKSLALAFLGAAVALLAQAPNANSGSTTGVSIPTLGFVAGQAPARLQPILGIPGSARLGSPVLLPMTVTRIHLAPGHAYALVEQARGNPLALVSLQAITAQTHNLPLAPMPGVIGEADVFAFSPTGRSAALYSRQTNQLQVLTGLPKSPQLLLNVPNLAIANAPQKIAVSDDAQAVLISDSAGSVYSVSQNAAPVPVHHSPEISALAFVAQSRESIICDRSLNTISFLRDSNATPVALGPATNDRCEPEAAASTADGKTILLACPAQRAVLSIDRASGLARLHRVGTSPGALQALGVRDVFLMTPAERGIYWLFVWGPNGPVASFVAAARNASQGSDN